MLVIIDKKQSHNTVVPLNSN